jgi:putative FmdB family regulatory protein
MPTYEYFCEKCLYLFEESFKKYEDTISPCPKCDSAAERKPSAPSIFKSGTSRESVDIQIGRESERRWSDIKSRQEKKENIRKESGQQALQVEHKLENGKITYEYKPVSKDRIAERKNLYSDYEKSEKKS